MLLLNDQRSICVLSAAACLVQVIYTHRIKHFQDESEGDPSALLIPALLDAKVRQQVHA